MSTVTEIWNYRSLIYNLAQRDLRARYKKSVLGWTWSLLNPAATLLIYTLVFGQFLRVVPPPAHNPDVQVFALYLFCGLVVWNAFSSVLMGSINSLQAMGTLLTKVYFPAASPALATSVSAVTQTFIELGVLLAVMVVVGNASWAMLLSPLVVLPVFVFALGLGLALSAYNVLYRDVGYLVGIAVNILFYLTPIVYTIDLVPANLSWLRRVIELNPITKFVTMARDLAYLGRLPTLSTVAYSVVAAVTMLVVGWLVFSRKARDVIEEL